MKRLVVTAVSAAALLVAAQANATPCSSTIMFPSGNGSELFSALGPGVCVLAQDKLFSNFNFGNLPTGGTVSFQLQVLAGRDNHNVTFTDQYAARTTYTGFGFTITSEGPPISEVLADFPQTTGGPTTFVETTTPAGAGSIDLSKTANSPSGPYKIDYDPGALSLIVSEVFTVGVDSNATAIQDTFVQQAPEPASLGLLGAALLGFGLAHCRRSPA
jgi:hypothetical protein